MSASPDKRPPFPRASPPDKPRISDKARQRPVRVIPPDDRAEMEAGHLIASGNPFSSSNMITRSGSSHHDDGGSGGGGLGFGAGAGFGGGDFGATAGFGGSEADAEPDTDDATTAHAVGGSFPDFPDSSSPSPDEQP